MVKKKTIFIMFAILLLGCAQQTETPKTTNTQAVNASNVDIAAAADEAIKAIEEVAPEKAEVPKHIQDVIEKYPESGIVRTNSKEDSANDPVVEVINQDPDKWCSPGEIYRVAAQGATVEATIIGFEQYAGKTFCKGQHEQNVQDMQISTTYYFTQAGEELYAISSFGGMVTETHIKDGELVSTNTK